MKKVLKYLLNFFVSMKLAILLLSAIFLLTILQATSEKFVTPFKSWKWLADISSIDFYQSDVFIMVMILFCINLVACNLKHLPITINLFRKSSREFDENVISSLPVVKRFRVKGYGESSEKLLSFITTYFNKPTLVIKESGQLNLYAERGRYIHFAFYLAHLSILVIVLGVMLSTGGYEYSFEIREDQIIDPLTINDGKGVKKTLPFSLLCESVKTIHYQGIPEVRKHQSILTILSDGKRIKTKVVDFGCPLSYKGIEIYQEHYSSRKIQYAKIEVVSRDGERQVYEVKSGGSFKLKGTGINIIATRLKSNALRLRSSSSPERIWVSHNPVSFSDKRLMDYQFSLIEILPKEATSLKIIRDPGKGLIWYSFISMVVGFVITLFFSHQRVWAKVEGKEGACTITLAGSANKDLKTIEELFNIIQNEFSKV